MLVNLFEARQHLRIDSGFSGSPDDAWLEIMIPAVSEAVHTWLKDQWRAFVIATDSNGDAIVDSNGNPVPEIDESGQAIVNPLVKGAVLVELATQYRFREGEGEVQVPSHWGHGYVLSLGATRLLASLRRSTVV